MRRFDRVLRFTIIVIMVSRDSITLSITTMLSHARVLKNVCLWRGLELAPTTWATALHRCAHVDKTLPHAVDQQVKGLPAGLLCKGRPKAQLGKSV